MLSCHDVQEHLAAIETGEPASGDVRDHLATCGTCRAEAAAVRTDLARLRRDLASLAPSPFLEDAVVAAARGEGASVPARRAAWLPASIGIAAAALLAVLVFVTKLPHGPHAAGDGEPFGKDPGGPSLVEAPPTVAQVAAARKARLAGVAGELETAFYGMVGAPEPGTVIVGRRLIERMGRKEYVDLGGDEGGALAGLVRKRPGYVTVWVGAPGGQGPAAMVRGRLDDTYAGSLLIEETLGRALDLQDHEIPGGVTVGGDTSMSGERAQATVRIGGFEGASDVEVVREGVPLPAEPLRSGGLPQAPRIVIHGEQPDVGFLAERIGIHHEHGASFVVATKTVSFQSGTEKLARLDVDQVGPWQAALGYHAGPHPECLVFLPSLDFGGGGILAWAVRMERVTLKPTFEPGAMVTIARVWRGRTAIPSRESVAHTTADEHGAVSFVHVRGERGPLRAREVRKDGTVKWHELPGEDAPRTGRKPLVLTPEGRVHLGGSEFALWEAAGGNEPAPEAVAALGDLLARLRDSRGPTDAPLVLALVATPETPWRRVETLLLLCAHPDVRIRDVEFAFPWDSGGTPYRLPVDAGVLAPPEDVRVLKVHIEWRGADLRWRTQGEGDEHEGPLDASAAGLDELERILRAAVSSGAAPPLAGEIRPVGAAARALPYAAVRAVIERMQAARVDRILLESTPPRRAR